MAAETIVKTWHIKGNGTRDLTGIPEVDDFKEWIKDAKTFSILEFEIKGDTVIFSVEKTKS